MGDVFTASESKFFIGPAVTTEPANATAYAALEWVEIGLVETLGEYGDESSAVNFTALSDGRTRKNKGTKDAGTLALTVGHDPLDEGQQALDAAEATKNNYAFRVVLPNKPNPTGTDEINYFVGLVMSKRKNVGAADNVIRRTYNIGINSKITEVAPTAGA